MRIACPVCNATYQVPDAQLSAGRTVRCARCASDWTPIEAEPEPEPEIPEAAANPQLAEALARAMPERMALEDIASEPPGGAQPEPARRGWLLAIAWVLSLVLVGAALAFLFARREEVMRVWPPSVRAYALLGLAGGPVASERIK
ncbi:MAG: zinc-ribbon domain-containing protein [Acetobacteraceae bacterium]|nr:zinc-ribbon domain-containing protein [Acetobacteraceae bacterium]